MWTLVQICNTKSIKILTKAAINCHIIYIYKLYIKNINKTTQSHWKIIPVKLKTNIFSIMKQSCSFHTIHNYKIGNSFFSSNALLLKEYIFFLIFNQ